MSGVNPVFQKFLITLVFANCFKTINLLTDATFSVKTLCVSPNAFSFFVGGGH